ncbi:MAG TPA: DUF2235 domain-containing protein [Beijerinckiaceae bacterium]|nr:DUF2235 domain-containing protein [Beijerinckiaceae bacterium]
MAKNIILLSDGTGNSAGKLFRTNVWRLYQALDLGKAPEGAVRQVAHYDDGVGTSTFKPLAILGGVFGVGLKRNVTSLYRFLCQNYETGDSIYVFGFSRGAFTIRVLTGLIANEGVLRDLTEEELDRHVRDAYRAYRYRYKLPLKGTKKAQQRRMEQAEQHPREVTVGLVDVLRKARDGVINLWRRARHQMTYDEVRKEAVEEIRFVGAWDTVAAYGGPFAELTRGIDEWVWPLSMPDYKLSKKVRDARHALALDDERDAFHPLLWDELAEEERKLPEGRLRQVWFTGMHSDVGGGYPDDGLAHIPLEWMMGEAGRAGLRFKPCAVEDLRCAANRFGPIHDSRRGLGGYYRYQPRKIAARLQPPDPKTLLMQDPERGGRGFLTAVYVHESVIDRIRIGDDRYAPIVLPAEFSVVGASGAVLPDPQDPAAARAARQEWVWNDVWKRRVTYFTTVGVSLLLASLPLLQAIWPPSACTGPTCLLSPLILGVGEVLPGVVQPWLRAYARTPGLFALLAIAIGVLLSVAGSLQGRIHAGMRELWMQSLGLQTREEARTPAGRSAGLPDDWIYRLRASRGYQRAFQGLKWRWVPNVFGIILLFGGLALFAALLVLMGLRTNLAFAERSGRICKIGSDAAVARGAPPAGAGTIHSTSSLCWSTPFRVEKKRRYRLAIVVTRPWFDGTIPATPEGFGIERMPWSVRYGAVLTRRSLMSRWFQPVLRIVRPNGAAHLQVLE